jgi:VWFA-related protein
MITRSTSSRHSSAPKHRPTLVFALLAAPALLTGSFGQANSEKASGDQTVLVNADEVSLNLVVRDKKNKPVLDLKAGDIVVTDAGSPVQISNLRFVTGEPGAEHLLTLVFDRLDSAAGRNARDIASKILKAVPQNEFSFCVLRAEGRLKLYEDFTSDRTALARAINLATDVGKPGQGNGAEFAEKRLMAIAKTGTDEQGAGVAAKERANAQVMLAALQESQRIVQEQHTQPSLSGLLALARSERKFPGRKTVIFFAQGLQADTSTEEMLRSVIDAANRGGVSIYAIDANALTQQVNQGLMAMAAVGNVMANRAMNPTPVLTGPPQGMADITPAGMGVKAGDQLSRFESADPNSPKGPLADLAESTGGVYIGAGDSLSKPLHRMIEDMTTYYEASYAPPIKNYDGQFRPISVKPVRAGLKIQSRTGYFALPPDKGSSIRPFEAPLLEMLGEAQLPSDLKFRSRVLRLGDLLDGNENALVVEVPVADLEARDDPNTNLYSLHVSIVAQIKNRSGAVIEHFSEDVPRHGALDSKEAARSEFITMQRHFIADPGAYVVEAAILDQNSGKGGAQRLEFEVPGATTGPSLSDLTMVQRIAPFPEEADPAEPLRYGDGKVVPSLASQVSHGTKDLSFFFVVHPDPDSAEQPRLEMEVLRSNDSIAQVPLQLRKTSGPATIPYVATIRASALPSGEYEVVERLTQGGKSAERSLRFRIEGPVLAGATAPESATGVANNGAESATASDLPETSGHNGRLLIITPLPAGAVPPPSADDLQGIVAAARKHALGYAKSLPNFICVEVTNRSVDVSGNGNWKPRDSIAELLRYHDNEESRSTLEVNGKRSSLQRTDMNETWPLSVGEFGGLLNVVFQPSSKAEFEWKEAGALEEGNGTLQVLSYRVARENATIALSDGNERIGVGFHGLVYIDPATGGVRRITLVGDDLPRRFSIHAASMTADYGYVAIGNHDHLVPMRASVSLQRGRKGLELNEMAFRNYRRFASQTKILLIP